MLVICLPGGDIILKKVSAYKNLRIWVGDMFSFKVHTEHFMKMLTVIVFLLS